MCSMPTQRYQQDLTVFGTEFIGGRAVVQIKVRPVDVYDPQNT